MTPGHHPSQYPTPDDRAPEDPPCACCQGADGEDLVAAHEAWLARTIGTHGWAVQAVLADGPDDPAYAYTIGMHSFGEHPELLVSGLPATRAAEILNLLGERIRTRQRLDDGQRLALTRALTVQMRAVTPLASDVLLLGANERYRHPDGPAVPALQAIWADSLGNMPWDPHWTLGAVQPLATLPPPGRGTWGGRIWYVPARLPRRLSQPRIPRPRQPPEIH